MAHKQNTQRLKTAKSDYEDAVRNHDPGSGERFAAMEKVAKAGGARDPGAVAAAIGRKKYGKKRFQEMAAAGKRKAQ